MAIAHRCERSGPEHLADHRSVLKERLALRRERVETRGDQAMDGVGKREVIGRTELEEEPHVLLGVERVAARALEECRLRLGG